MEIRISSTYLPTYLPTYSSYLVLSIKKALLFMLWGILGITLVLPAWGSEREWKENEAFRDGQTRVWESVKVQEVKNPFTGEISVNTVAHQYYEKADGLNYNAGTKDKPKWLPSVETISPTDDPYFPYQANQGPYQVRFGASINQTTPIEYTVGKETLRLGLKYLAYYDKKKGTLKPFKTLNHVNPVMDGNKVIYRDAFSGIDVEYVYQKGVFQQNIKINSKGILGNPETYGISTDDAYLVAVTEIDTTDFSTEFENTQGDKMAQGLLKGEGCDILFRKNGKNISILAPSIAYYQTINRGIVSKESIYQEDTVVKEIPQYRHIFQQDNKNFLLEGISVNDLDEAFYPITLDYEIKTGGSNSNQTWREGCTYYLSGDYTINSGNTLVIEPGTIVKYGVTKKLVVASGGRLIAKGDKYNYVLMTSWKDNQVGETISGSNGYPQSSDYTTAVYLQANSISNHYIQYCKISYAYCGLDIQTKIDNPVENNIFRNDFMYPVKISSVGSPAGDGITFRNNLITGTMYCISLYGGTNYVELYNNTLNAFGCGVYIGSGSPLTQAKYNLFSNGNVGFNGAAIPDSVHSDNYHYNISFPILNGSPTGEYVIPTTSDLYDSSSNGSFYLANSAAKNRKDFWLMTLNPSELSLLSMITSKTTQKPEVVTSSSCGDHWVKVSRDNDSYLDVGYHYDPVDVVVGTSASDYAINYGTGLITIDPGVVVSFYRDSNHLGALFQLSGLGCVSTGGTPSDKVQFTSIYATSDLPTLPKQGGLDPYDYECAIYLSTGSKTVESLIQNCIFQYADEAVFTGISLNTDRAIRDNLFRKNVIGFCIMNRLGNVVNNIFDSNNYGIWLIQNDETRQVNYLQSNTFYSNQTAVYAQQSINSSGKLTFRLENNILVDNKMGVCGTGVTGGFTAETRNNVYWNNDSNVDGTWVHFNTLGGENSDTAVNPLLAHAARCQNSALIPLNSDDGFYLAQRSGDASRFPLQINDLASSNGIEVTGITNGTPFVYAYASNASNAVGTLLGTYNDIEYIDESSATGNLLLKISGQGQFDISAGDYIILNMANDSQLKVYLPVATVGEGGDENLSLWLWVATDGSSFYARRSHASEEVDQPDQDAWYAMGYDVPNGLAKSAYDGGARSVAVDRGAVKVTNYQNYTYKYTLSVSTGFTNTNKTSQDNSSIHRKISAIIPTQTADPVGRLDAGFHYGSSVYYTTDAVTAFRMDNSIYTYFDPHWPDDSQYTPLCIKLNPEVRKIVSGKKDNNTLNMTEMVIFSALGDIVNPQDNTSKNYMALGYHIQNTPIVNGIVKLESAAKADALAYDPKLGPEIHYIDTASSANGDILCSVLWSKYYLNQSQENVHEETINAYRFNDDYSWSPVMSLGNTRINDGGLHLAGMSISANDSYLWMSISGTDENNSKHIKAKRIPMGQYQTYNYSEFDECLSGYSSPLSMTFDTTGNYGRIAYYSSDNGVKIFELCTRYNDEQGVVASVYTKEAETDEASIASNLYLPIGKITYNPADISGDQRRCFLAYNTGYQNTAESFLSMLNVATPGNEFWDTADDSIALDHGGADVTYRADGTALLAVSRHFTYHGLITNVGGISQMMTPLGGSLLKVCTNPINQRDIMASWHEDNENEGYAVSRELYP